MEEEGFVEVVKEVSLKVLSPRVRLMVIVLESLAGDEGTYEGIRRECNRYGFSCKMLRAVLSDMVELGIVTRSDGGKYVLTEYGQGLAEILQSVHADIAEFARKIHSGDVEAVDVYSVLLTPVASCISVAESKLEYGDMIRALGLTAYISALAAAALSLGAAKSDKLAKLIERVEREITGEA